MKGIILAAGKGTRLYPVTKPVCKPLLPVYDKPMIYYPMSVLMNSGIKDILVITPPDDTKPFTDLLGDGSHLGIKITYIEQKVQRGIADAFLIGKEFIGNDSVCLALGDNIFYGPFFIKPSARGELEITSVNEEYLKRGNLRVIALGKEFSWFDAGSADSLYEAAGAIRAAQRSGNMIGCLEEIALRKGWINEESFRELADSMNKTNYGQYLGALAEEL